MLYRAVNLMDLVTDRNGGKITEYEPISPNGKVRPNSLFSPNLRDFNPEEVRDDEVSVDEMKLALDTGKIQPTTRYSDKLDWLGEMKWMELPTKFFTPVAWFWVKKIVPNAKEVSRGVNWDTFVKKWEYYITPSANTKSRRKYLDGLKRLEADDCLTSNHLAVIPQKLRPILIQQFDSVSVRATGTNKLYMNLGMLLEGVSRTGKLDTYAFAIQEAVADCGILPSKLLAAKKKFIWENVIGCRMDYSGTAVIIPKPASLKPERDFGKIIIPASMFAILHEPVIVGLLRDRYPISQILDMIYERAPIKLQKLGVLDYIESQGVVGLSNRPPSIIIGSVMKNTFGYNRDLYNTCIMIDSCLCANANADYDGDLFRVILFNTWQTADDFEALTPENLLWLPHQRVNPRSLPTKDFEVGLSNLR